MKFILFFVIACAGMRYSACNTVKLGEECSEAELHELECTKLPAFTITDDCYQVFLEDHIVAQCQKKGDHFQWMFYDSCSDGLYAQTNGTEFQCEQAIARDCQWKDPDWRDTGRW